MGQDDPGAMIIDLAGSEVEEEEVVEVVVMMIHHHHMITILHLSRPQHVHHREHRVRRGGDLAFGLERWVVRQRDIWRATEVRISNLELSVPQWVMGVTIMGREARDGVVGRAQDRVEVLALALGLGPVGMRARALGEQVGGKC